MNNSIETNSTGQKKREGRVFLFLTVVMAPLFTVAVVGFYGLAIWLFQIFNGPPKG